MSRASEITLFIILVQASIGFVDATGLFTSSYMTVPQNNASYTLSDLDSYAAQANEDSSFWAELDVAAHWAVESFLIGIKILFAVVFVLPSLVNTFGIDMILATFIQVGIYYVYAVWYTQYKSGKPWGMIKEI